MTPTSLATATASFLLVASVASAQLEPPHRTALLDLTLGRHETAGGFRANRTGAMLDLLAAGTIRSTPKAAFVGAIGASAILGGFGDSCLIRPSGGCAPKSNFLVGNALAGADLAFGAASTRVLLGPALYGSEDDTSLGAQGRVDLYSPTLARLGLGIMLRATWLPSQSGESLLGWALGGSLVFR